MPDLPARPAPVTFEHVASLKDPTDRPDEWTALQQCSECAALVLPAGREQHAAWHTGVPRG